MCTLVHAGWSLMQWPWYPALLPAHTPQSGVHVGLAHIVQLLCSRCRVSTRQLPGFLYTCLLHRHYSHSHHCQCSPCCRGKMQTPQYLAVIASVTCSLHISSRTDVSEKFGSQLAFFHVLARQFSQLAASTLPSALWFGHLHNWCIPHFQSEVCTAQVRISYMMAPCLSPLRGLHSHQHTYSSILLRS